MSKFSFFPDKQNSTSVDNEMAAKIKSMLDAGMYQHDIAAHFKINQGRVSEIKTGLRFTDVKPDQYDLFGL